MEMEQFLQLSGGIPLYIYRRIEWVDECKPN